MPNPEVSTLHSTDPSHSGPSTFSQFFVGLRLNGSHFPPPTTEAHRSAPAPGILPVGGSPSYGACAVPAGVCRGNIASTANGDVKILRGASMCTLSEGVSPGASQLWCGAVACGSERSVTGTSPHESRQLGACSPTWRLWFPSLPSLPHFLSGGLFSACSTMVLLVLPSQAWLVRNGTMYLPGTLRTIV